MAKATRVGSSRAARKPPSKKWQALLRLVPGYDPIATAGDAWFDAAAAEAILDFFPACLRHVEGELAGKPFALEPWQKSFLANLIGWKRKDEHGREVRRYREALLYVPRKNGKSPMGAGLALYLFFCDPEAGQQDYIAAADKEQAGILFRHCKGMIQQEPELLSRCRIYGGNAQAGQARSIVREEDCSFLKIISADADTQHGGNTHLAIIDELHTQPDRDLVDVIQSSFASKNRRQPLMVCITTADYHRPSICNEKHTYACKVRDGIISDPSFLPCIYEALPEEPWDDEKVWAKANPNLGVSVSLDFLRRECERAKEIPAYQNTFRRLHCNQKTEQSVRWLPMDKWDACANTIDPEALRGRRCFGALDLSSKVDLTAEVLVFPPTADDPLWRILARFFAPQERAEQREKQDRIPYIAWAREGLIQLTDGNVVDYDFVKAQVLADAKAFDMQEIAYDPWNATQIALQLQEAGAKVVEFQQGFRSMSEPAKELEKLIVSGKIAHGGNKVLRWMAGNVFSETDPAGNIKPSKKKSTEKIDGIVAVIMALGRAMVDNTSNPTIDWI